MPTAGGRALWPCPRLGVGTAVPAVRANFRVIPKPRTNGANSRRTQGLRMSPNADPDGRAARPYLERGAASKSSSAFWGRLVKEYSSIWHARFLISALTAALGLESSTRA